MFFFHKNRENNTVLFSDTSSDEDDPRSSFATRKRKQPYNVEDATPSRSTVIVSPANNTSGFSFNATSSSQDSGSSSDDSEDEDEHDFAPSAHKKFIKPKQASAPVIDQKAKNMMVS